MPLGRIKGAKNFSMTTGQLGGRQADGTTINPFQASARSLFGGERRAKAAAASQAAAQLPGRSGSSKPDMKFVPGLSHVSATLSEVLREKDEDDELNDDDAEAICVPGDIDASGSIVRPEDNVPLSPVLTESQGEGLKGRNRLSSFELDTEYDGAGKGGKGEGEGGGGVAPLKDITAGSTSMSARGASPTAGIAMPSGAASPVSGSIAEEEEEDEVEEEGEGDDGR